MELHSYSEKAENVCHWPKFKRDALVFGVELEVEPRSHSSQSAILDVLPERSNYFCKDDGSLRNGVEIVTVPGTLEWHRDTFNWQEVLNPLLAIAMSGSRTQRCGMHIHINRRSMTPLTLAKMYLFINAPENLRFMESIAQRSNTHWATMQKKKWADAMSPGTMEASAGRYQAMNVTTPTAELRLFRGTIRHDRVLKNIEAAHALVTWCRENSAADCQDYRKFAAYVKQSNQWPHLSGFMAETGVA